MLGPCLGPAAVAVARTRRASTTTTPAPALFLLADGTSLLLIAGGSLVLAA